MKLTKKKAIELSIKKWEWIAENDGDYGGVLVYMPELNEMDNNCPLCEYDTKQEIRMNKFAFCGNCCYCPLYKAQGCVCADYDSAFTRFNKCRIKETAQAVLDLIKSCK